jgi:hypothetical protein
MAQNTKKRSGFIVSAELIFIATILVIGLIAGWVLVRDTTLGELADVGNAIGSVNQSYTYNGVLENAPGEFSATAGSFFIDNVDTSDGAVILVDQAPIAEDTVLAGP